MDYLDKYKGQYGRRSIYDILALDPNNQADWNAIKSNYVAADMEKVVIGGNTFTNYGDFQFAWEKSYVKSPERSADGSIGNLNSYATFVTPHLIINFGVMSIEDYRKIMLLDLSQNEFVVECYDPIYNKKFTGKMYFGTPQMAKLLKLARIRFDGDRWEEFVELVGVQEYTVELIGTNADLDLVSVIYHYNPPSDVTGNYTSIAEPDIYKGEEVIIGTSAGDITSETFNGKYKFSKWNVSPEKPTTPKDTGNYIDGYAYTINKDLHLYAQWESVNTRTLTFSYGVADTSAGDDSDSLERSRTVTTGKSIGALPPIPTVKVKHKDIYGVEQDDYTPYYGGNWYKIPTLTENASSMIIKGGEAYWSNYDRTAYLLYETRTYTLNLYIDGEWYQSNEIEYGSPMNLPNLQRESEQLDGWYSSPTCLITTKWSGNTMPPYNLTLYARWMPK